jgi:hypothetical protein
MRFWAPRVVAGVALASSGLLICAGPASAAPSHVAPLQVVKTLSSDFVGPLQFAVAGHRVLVADSFTSTLSEIGRAAPLATGPSPEAGGDLAGVAIDARTQAVAYASSNGDHSSTQLTILRPGHRKVVADLSSFERKRNPDGRVRYGVDRPSDCVIKALTAAQFPVSYTGELDSHPYAAAALGNGAWAVADAGGNDLLKVDRYGRVSLLAVLPPQPVRISSAMAAEFHLDPCVVGVTYKFEAVPTDVEVGPHGALFVTTLPGGPEGPSAGNRGSVYRVDRGGHATRVATGFAGATNLAIGPRGVLYVAELSAGRISKVECGRRYIVADLPGVAAVEYANGKLYAATAPAAAGGQGPGTVVVLGSQRS